MKTANKEFTLPIPGTHNIYGTTLEIQRGDGVVFAWFAGHEGEGKSPLEAVRAAFEAYWDEEIFPSITKSR